MQTMNTKSTMFNIINNRKLVPSNNDSDTDRFVSDVVTAFYYTIYTKKYILTFIQNTDNFSIHSHTTNYIFINLFIQKLYLNLNEIQF